MRIRPEWLFISFIFLVPYVGTYTYQKYRPSVDWEQSSEGLVVYMSEYSEDHIVEENDYILGLLGAVMQPEDSIETVKAMAVVFRTYLYYMANEEKLIYSDLIGLSWYGPKERKRKGINDKILKKAIQETDGCLLLSDDAPILPLYHEVSNGKTHSFLDVWGKDICYLVSVDSVWDKSHPAYIQKVSVSKSQWKKVWGEETADGGQWPDLNMQIVEKDEAGYVKQIQIGADVYSGEEVRCRLGLPSACFEYRIRNHCIEFTCYGKGHGVGLSLYGANAMAEEGKSWKEIIQWYYPGVNF